MLGALISNMVPAQLTGVSWTCTGQNNGVCGAASGTGPLTTVANLPVDAAVTYVVSGTIVAGTGTGLVSETSEQCISGGACVEGACLPPAQGQYALSGGGLSGCTYGDPKGASGGAALAGLALLAVLARRRRSFGRAAA